MPTTRILFVDDDTRILDGLRRSLQQTAPAWQPSFVSDGQTALAHLAQETFDIIVTDMRMPGITGTQLLTSVREQHPGVIRFALSGYSDEQLFTQTANLVHRFLPKPCPADELYTAVERALSLRSLLTDPSLQRTVTRIGALPVQSTKLTGLLQALDGPAPSLSMIGDLIAQDFGLTTKVLQLVNSAFYGLRQAVTSPHQAVVLLGLEMLRSLALTVSVFSSFEGNVSDQYIDALYQHTLRVGSLSKRLAGIISNDATILDRALLSGMLHDVGKIVMLKHFPEAVARLQQIAQREHSPLYAVEYSAFGCCHAEIGGYLLGLWNFDEAIVNAVAYHHVPVCSHRNNLILASVHVADILDRHHHRSQSECVGEPARDFLSECGYHDLLSFAQNEMAHNTGVAP